MNIIKMEKYYEEGPIYQAQRENKIVNKGKAVAVFVLEYAKNGSLIDHLMQAGRMEAKLLRYYFKQLISGLHHLHSFGVSHRDIKPDNILLTEDFTLKIADFGMCGIKEAIDTKFTDRIGTEAYQPPEVRHCTASTPYDGAAADVFSSGVTFFAMARGYPPFSKP
jgi:serine/threonine protein kinase